MHVWALCDVTKGTHTSIRVTEYTRSQVVAPFCVRLSRWVQKLAACCKQRAKHMALLLLQTNFDGESLDQGFKCRHEKMQVEEAGCTLGLRRELLENHRRLRAETRLLAAMMPRAQPEPCGAFTAPLIRALAAWLRGFRRSTSHCGQTLA